MKKIRVCTSCGKYTLQTDHCGVITASGHPSPYNPNDRYGEYRRKIKGV